MGLLVAGYPCLPNISNKLKKRVGGGLNKPQKAIPKPEIMYERNAMILSVIFTEKLSIRKPKHRLAASASCKKKTAALLADIQVVDLVWYSHQRERFF